MKATNIEGRILDILASISTDGDRAVIVQQLERKDYVETNKVLEALGGKWNKSLKAHIFPGDAGDLIDGVLATGEYVDSKKLYQFFETPPDLARELVEWAEIGETDHVCEPSAGDGALVRWIPKCAHLYVLEMDLSHTAKLVESLSAGPNNASIRWQDFLEFTGDKLVDGGNVFPGFTRVVMNPPFAGRQDLDHIWHAWNLCIEGAIITAICAEGVFFRQDRKSLEFMSLLNRHNAEIIKNDDGAFKASGTMVRTRRIKLTKRID